MKKIFPAFLLAIAGVLSGALPVQAFGPEDVPPILRRYFGGTINGAGATTGQALVKQADGSWGPGTVTSGWNSSLGVNATTGGHNPLITTGDGIAFRGAVPVANQIVGLDGIQGSTVSTLSLLASAQNDVWIQAGGDGSTNATGGQFYATEAGNGAGGDVDVVGGNANTAGSNKDGGPVLISPGFGTGTGASLIKLGTYHSNGAGTTAQTFRYVAQIDGTGNLLLNYGLLQFGGTSSSFVAIKGTGSQLFVRLADDSGYANLGANSVVANSYSYCGDAFGFSFSTRSLIRSAADGNLCVTNNNATDFGLLQLGGTSSSFPAIKRSSTTVAFRLADDSADCPISASGGVFSGQYYSAQHTTTTTLDWNTGNCQSITLANNGQTFTFANPNSGGRYLLRLKQPASGAAGTVTWPAAVHWSGGTTPTLTATNSQVDIVTFYYDGTSYFGASDLNFAP